MNKNKQIKQLKQHKKRAASHATSEESFSHKTNTNV